MVPKPAARLACRLKVPCDSVRPPVWPEVSSAEPKVSVPLPLLVKLFEPPSVPVSVSVLAPVSMLDPPALAFTVLASEKLPVVSKVPPLSDTAPEPILAAAPIDTVPP